MASAEDATPAKAGAAVQIWPGLATATVTLRPEGLKPGGLKASCGAAILLASRH